MSNAPSQCLSWSWHLECMELERKAGFAAALDAAEEAVRAALGTDHRNLHAELTALAAIDALKEKNND